MSIENIVLLIKFIYTSLKEASIENEGVMTFGFDDLLNGVMNALDDGAITRAEFVEIVQIFAKLGTSKD